MPRRSYSCATFLLLLTNLFLPRQEGSSFALAAKPPKSTTVPFIATPAGPIDAPFAVAGISVSAEVQVMDDAPAPIVSTVPASHFWSPAPENHFWKLENDLAQPDGATITEWLSKNFRETDYALYPYMDAVAQEQFKQVLATRALKRPEYLQKLTETLTATKRAHLSMDGFQSLSRELRYFSRDYSNQKLLKWVAAHSSEDDVDDWRRIALTYRLEHLSGVLVDALPADNPLGNAEGFLAHYIYYFFALLPQRYLPEELQSVAAIFWEEMHGDAYIRSSGSSIETVISNVTGESFIDLACKKYPFIAARIFAIMQESGVEILHPARLAMLAIQNKHVSVSDYLFKQVILVQASEDITFVDLAINEVFENFMFHLDIQPNSVGEGQWVRQHTPV